MFKVGNINKYYDKLGIGIVELDGNIAVGDQIKFVLNGNELFEQSVDSIQIGHQKTSAAKRGDVIGLKLQEAVPEGTEIFKV